MFVIMVGVLSALTIMIVMLRLGMDKFAGHPAIMDLAVTAALAYFLYGSYAGITAAIIGGLTFSAIITIYRYLFGYTRLTLKGWIKKDGAIARLKEKLNQQATYGKEMLKNV